MAYNETVSLGESVPQVQGALRDLESALNFLESVTPELVSRVDSVLAPENAASAGTPQPGYSCSLAALIDQQARRIYRQGEYLHSVKSRVEL